MSSCVNEDDLNPQGSPVDSTIEIRISARKVMTRTAGHDLAEGSKDDDESFIDRNSNNYAFYLVDEADNQKIVQQIDADPSLSQDDDGDELYHIRCILKDVDIDKEYRILAVANWLNDFGGSYSGFVPGVTTMESLYKNESSFNFELNTPWVKIESEEDSDDIDQGISDVEDSDTPGQEEDTESKTENGYFVSWVPQKDKGAGIPMFGLSKPFKIKKKTVEKVEVPMLRSLAKITVNNMAGNSVEFTDCRLTTFNTSGRFIPDAKLNDNSEWNDESKQVSTPTLPPGVATSDYKLHFIANEDKSSYVVYIPEMDFSEDETTRPEIELAVKTEGFSTTYKIQLAAYDLENGIGKKFDYILRNHSYTFNIHSVGADAALTIEAIEWNVYDDITWSYEDATPVFADEENKIEWNEQTKFENDLTIIVSTEQFAEGSFTLVKPINGTWTLSIVTEDLARSDYFNISIWDESSRTFVEKGDSFTSNITGDEVKFQLKGTRENNTGEDYTARLILTSATDDGRIMKVDLTPKDTEGDYFIIKQLTKF